VSEIFHSLTVLDTKSEIGGKAKTVSFEVPKSLTRIFAWRAGQHLSLCFKLHGKEERRSYSISSSPVSGDPLQITVKRVAGGLVSNHINDHIKKGDVIEVMPPFGSFFLDTANNNRRTHYFFGAGSGITPLFSMLHSVMCNEPHSVAYLAYGNKNADSILLRELLDKLTTAYRDRLGIHYVLSSPSMWNRFEFWRKGIVDATVVEALISENPPYAQDAQYYVCGPGSMNGTVKAALMSLDVPANRIHMESYGGDINVDDSVNGLAGLASITLNQSTHEVAIAENQTVLQAALKAGLKPPYSCQAGVCGACRATLSDGMVHMRARMALDDSDIDDGSVLTCQSVLTSKHISVDFDKD